MRRFHNVICPFMYLILLSFPGILSAQEPCIPDTNYSGIMGGDGTLAYTPSVGWNVNSGNPQVGFDHACDYGDDFWMNDTDAWVTPIAAYPPSQTPTPCVGFFEYTTEEDENYVQVRLRSYDDGSAWHGWQGNFHQSDGWFRFRVRPDGHINDPVRFEITLGPDTYNLTQMNAWFLRGLCWDFGVFTPMYRFISAVDGTPISDWVHTDPGAPVGTICAPDATHTPRPYRCRYEINPVSWPTPQGTPAHLEIAHSLPYTLDDRDTFWNTYMATPPPGVCTRKVVDLDGDSSADYGGLAGHSIYPEDHSFAVWEICKADANGDPDLPEHTADHQIIIALAGIDYEPPGNWVAHGVVKYILDNPDILDEFSFVIIPVGNPDGIEWGTCHLVPYGNGYNETTIDPVTRGYGWFNQILHYENNEPTPVPDPEAMLLHQYFKRLTDPSLGYDFVGIVPIILDFQADVCPHPSRWLNNEEPPSLYGYFGYKAHNGDDSQWIIQQFISDLSSEADYLGPYIRPWTVSGYDCWHPHEYATPSTSESNFYEEYSIPYFITFEFDDTALYRLHTEPSPTWYPAAATPVASNYGGYDVDGYVDSISLLLTQTTPTPNPNYLFEQWGAEITEAISDNLVIETSPANLEDAIEKSVDGTVIILSNGTLTLTERIVIDTKRIEIRSENGAANCIIDGDGEDCVFEFTNVGAPGCFISGLTIQNGSNDEDGGGIVCTDSFVVFEDCIIEENEITTDYSRGGGIYCEDSNVYFDGCTIQNNMETANYTRGLGISLYGTDAILRNCVIDGNSGSANNARGKGISFEEYSTVTLFGCTISNNDQAYVGGGIYGSYSDFNIVDCTISGNEATQQGAGFAFEFSDGQMANCLIVENVLYNYWGRGVGGWINSYSDIDLKSCTISANTFNSTYYPTTRYAGVWAASSTVIKDCIIWGNTPAADQIPTGLSYVTYSDIYLPSSVYPGTGNLNTNPRFILGYRLSQLISDKSYSWCVNAGSRPSYRVTYSSTAGSITMDDMTTASNSQLDVSTLDMGFHYHP